VLSALISHKDEQIGSPIVQAIKLALFGL